MKLYSNDRHEILNELDKEVVYEDILNFLQPYADGMGVEVIEVEEAFRCFKYACA